MYDMPYDKRVTVMTVALFERDDTGWVLPSAMTVAHFVDLSKRVGWVRVESSDKVDEDTHLRRLGLG